MYFKHLLPSFVFFCFLLNPAFAQQALVEDCSNGIDDDGDGLIDCFDPECGCLGPCTTYFYNTCPTACFYAPPCDQITLGVDWTGNSEVGTYSVLVGGDLDADGIPEIVTYNVESNQIYIIDGASGQTKITINSPTVLPGGTSPALADLDNDGFGEIVIVGEDRLLRCYDHQGNIQYTSSVQVGYANRYAFSSPNIADFDHDGLPEVHIGNQIFNGQTGALLAEAGANRSAGEHPARRANGFSFNAPVAMDVLPDSFCPDCQGLEIVAGNEVFSVNLITGAVSLQVSAPAAYSDGFTSLADLDLDGDLDAIVQGRKNGWNTVYAWDIQTPTILGEYRLLNNWHDGASRVNIADLNNDNQLEMNFISYPDMYTLRNDFTLLWRKFNDDVSAVTSSSVFDFCGDGSADILYRGQTALQIIEGATGVIKWQDACISATHIECPLVMDVDADGQTEVIVTCGQNGGNNSGRVVAYETINTPGIPSRPVWNQHAYFNTNIEDNLRVPRYQQNPNLVADGIKLNGFLNQYFNPTFPAPDGELKITSAACQMDSIELIMEVCNLGRNILPGTTPIAFYTNNPTKAGSMWFHTALIGQNIPFDSCSAITMRVPRVANVQVFAVLNDDHSLPTPYNLDQDFPVTTIGECNFMNNVDSFQLNYAPKLLSLGADTLICDNATVLLAYQDPYTTSWLWQNGSTAKTFLAPDAGIYHLTTTDICQVVQTDTIAIGIDSSTVVQIGNDRELCKGESFTLNVPGFDFYAWQPVASNTCATCNTTTFTPPSSGNIVLTATLSNGCWSSDTLFAVVHDTTYQIVDTTVCYGLEVMANGVSIKTDTTVKFDLQSIYGCDSTVVYRVKGTSLGTYDITIDTAICKGKILTYASVTLLPGQQHIFGLTALTGCDSTVRLVTIPLDTFASSQPERICAGTSFDVFGVPQSSTGIYSKRFVAANGCDSTHTIELEVAPPLTLEFEAEPTCIDQATGSLAVLIAGGTPDYQIQWDEPSLQDIALTDLEAGSYAITVTDQLNCTTTGTADVPNYPIMNWLANPSPVRCYGERNGNIQLSATDSLILYSVDQQPFIQATTLTDLASGNYTITAQDINGCLDMRVVQVTEPDQLMAMLATATTVYLGDSLQLEVQTNAPGALQYAWSPPLYLSCLDCATPITKPHFPVRYSLLITDEFGCTATAQQLIDVDRGIHHFAPNAFAPESTFDANTGFMPFFSSAVAEVLVFQIFDRWGDIHHEVRNRTANDDSMKWFGKRSGKPAQTGVYVWAAQVALVDGSKHWLKGDVTLVK